MMVCSTSMPAARAASSSRTWFGIVTVRSCA